MRFLKKVEDKLKRLSEVERSLQDPAVASDPAAARDLGREFRSLEKVASAYRAYQRVEDELAQTSKMLEDKDHSDQMRELARGELENLKARKKKTLHDLEGLLIQDDPLLAKNVILEIRAANEAGGLKEIIASVTGEGAYGRFKYESGTHRVQRVPATEASGRIHTSAVTVAILPEAEEVDVEIRPEEVKVDVFRSGGPGGQSVNTTDSAVRLTHLPSGLVVSCQDEKSQLKNKQKAMKILRARLFEKITSERNAEIARTRREQVGSGDRSEKIRTYNFPDRRVTDHRIGLTVYNLEKVLDGDLEPFVDALYEDELEKS